MRWSNRNWRDIPMPDRVARLPRDKRGFPVPWVSEWSAPDGTESAMVPEPYEVPVTFGSVEACVVIPRTSCDHIYGQGVPDLGNLCPAQQTKGMLERLCDVCGEPIPDGPIYFVGSSDAFEEHGSIKHWLFRECGLHYECALYAMQVCPALLRVSPRGTASVFEATTYNRLPMVLIGSTADNLREEIALSEAALSTLALQSASQGEHLVLTGFYAELTEENSTCTPIPEWVGQQIGASA